MVFTPYEVSGLQVYNGMRNIYYLSLRLRWNVSNFCPRKKTGIEFKLIRTRTVFAEALAWCVVYCMWILNNNG